MDFRLLCLLCVVKVMVSAMSRSLDQRGLPSARARV